MASIPLHDAMLRGQGAGALERNAAGGAFSRDSAAALASVDAKTPARSKATGGGPFAKSCFALGTRRAELILGLSARLPMPRGRQLETPRWCHAVHTLPPS